ncbi:MAG: hypothetical protein RL385_1684 [Pseudomonadota bacterium]|jgi:hypothetical protein
MASYWEDLAPHAKRTALLLLREDHDLLDVAEVIASDDVAKLKAWLGSGALVRVSAADADALEAETDRRFQFVVVQPWVLAQRLLESP